MRNKFIPMAIDTTRSIPSQHVQSISWRPSPVTLTAATTNQRKLKYAIMCRTDWMWESEGKREKYWDENKTIIHFSSCFRDESDAMTQIYHFSNIALPLSSLRECVAVAIISASSVCSPNETYLYLYNRFTAQFDTHVSPESMTFHTNTHSHTQTLHMPARQHNRKRRDASYTWFIITMMKSNVESDSSHDTHSHTHLHEARTRSAIL